MATDHGPSLIELSETLRDDVGKAWPGAPKPHVEYATVDTIRAFAHGCGDDNPLFADLDHAASGVQRGLVAPPLFPLCTGVPIPDEMLGTVSPDNLAGLQQHRYDIDAETWTLLAPIRPGTRMGRRDTLAGVALVEAGPGDESGERLRVTIRSVYTDATTVYAIRDRVRIHGATLHRPPRSELAAPYTEEEIEAFAQANLAEQRRGPHTRLASDADVGDPVDPVVRGPLTLTDLISYRAGVGPGPLGAAPLRLGVLSRHLRPGTFDRDEFGVYEVRERCHWDAGYARETGHPGPYDYTHTRPTWLSFVLTDWMGDGGWLLSLTSRVLAHNYIGDTHWLAGRVTAVQEVEEGAEVHLDLECRNQLDQTTCTASAVVLLPADGSAAAHPAERRVDELITTRPPRTGAE